MVCNSALKSQPILLYTGSWVRSVIQFSGNPDHSEGNSERISAEAGSFFWQMQANLWLDSILAPVRSDTELFAGQRSAKLRASVRLQNQDFLLIAGSRYQPLNSSQFRTSPALQSFDPLISSRLESAFWLHAGPQWLPGLLVFEDRTENAGLFFYIEDTLQLAYSPTLKRAGLTFAWRQKPWTVRTDIQSDPQTFWGSAYLSAGSDTGGMETDSGRRFLTDWKVSADLLRRRHWDYNSEFKTLPDRRHRSGQGIFQADTYPVSVLLAGLDRQQTGFRYANITFAFPDLYRALAASGSEAAVFNLLISGRYYRMNRYDSSQAIAVNFARAAAGFRINTTALTFEVSIEPVKPDQSAAEFSAAYSQNFFRLKAGFKVYESKQPERFLFLHSALPFDNSGSFYDEKRAGLFLSASFNRPRKEHQAIESAVSVYLLSTWDQGSPDANHFIALQGSFPLAYQDSPGPESSLP